MHVYFRLMDVIDSEYMKNCDKMVAKNVHICMSMFANILLTDLVSLEMLKLCTITCMHTCMLNLCVCASL